MDYQKVPVLVPGMGAWQPQLARLRTVAISVLSSHVSNRGRCAACGSDWPCGHAVLAEHNLALCNDTGLLRPPEMASRQQKCTRTTRNGQVGKQRAFWPVAQPCQTSHGALGGDMTMQWPLRNSLQLGNGDRDEEPAGHPSCQSATSQVLLAPGHAQPAEGTPRPRRAHRRGP